MKATATKLPQKKEMTDIKYPILISDGNTVILADNKSDGTVLFCRDDSQDIGHYMESYGDEFVEYEGTLTLKND